MVRLNKKGEKCGFERPRVTHPLFGDGELLGILETGMFWMVRFDKDPPVEYNMGENPVLMFSSDVSYL